MTTVPGWGRMKDPPLHPFSSFQAVWEGDEMALLGLAQVSVLQEQRCNGNASLPRLFQAPGCCKPCQGSAPCLHRELRALCPLLWFWFCCCCNWRKAQRGPEL